MVDVHVIHNANRFLYERELDEHYRIRHRIYIEELKWRGLKPRADGRECDQFDTEESVYLLGLENEKVVGGLRLLPTTGPHLISDVFPQFASIRGVPRSPDIAEWTRIFVIPERREEHAGSKVSSTLVAAVIDYALDEGLSGLTALMNTIWLTRFHRYGWRVRPLGLPDLHDDEWLIAVNIDVTPAALAGVRRTCELGERSALVRKGPQRPFVQERRHVTAVA